MRSVVGAPPLFRQAPTGAATPGLARSRAIARSSCPGTAAVPAARDASFRIRLVLKRRAVARFGDGEAFSSVGHFQLRRRPPQALEVVVPPRFFAEDVHDEAAEIQQRPIRRAIALPVPHRPSHLFVELLFDFRADRLQLRRAKTRADDEVIGERASTAQVQHNDAGGFLFLGGLNCGAHALRQGFEIHRYRPCLRMYSSTRAETSPWMDCPRCARRRMSVAETSFATFSSK